MQKCIRCDGPVIWDWDVFLGWHYKCLQCSRTDEEVARMKRNGGKATKGYSINPALQQRHVYYERHKREIIQDYIAGGRRFVLKKWQIPKGTWWKLCDAWELPGEYERKAEVVKV